MKTNFRKSFIFLLVAIAVWTIDCDIHADTLWFYNITNKSEVVHRGPYRSKDEADTQANVYRKKPSLAVSDCFSLDSKFSMSDIENVNNLIMSGKNEEALTNVDRLLALAPNDPYAPRFLYLSGSLKESLKAESSTVKSTPPTTKTIQKIATPKPAVIEAPVMDSDTLTAHPGDPDRMAKGVSMDDIVPRLALKACQDAVAAYPKEARFRYELGRALEASHQYPEAMAAYRQAVDMNYRMAYYNLGLCYINGKGTDKNIEQGKAYLSAAADAGLDQAKETLGEYTFDSKGFSDPAFFQAIYDGTWKNIKGDQTDLATYLETFIEPIIKTSDCGMVISQASFTKLAQQTQVNVFARALGGAASGRGASHTTGDFAGAAAEGYHSGEQITVNLAAMSDKGLDDAKTFYQRYGCQTPVAKQFFSHLEDFANNLGSASFTHELEKYYHR